MSIVPALLLLAGGAQPPAFPGAEGFGAATGGGRGGRVIAVTTLADSGPGSFRAACQAEGPRIIVFRVGGLIGSEALDRDRQPVRDHRRSDGAGRWHLPARQHA